MAYQSKAEQAQARRRMKKPPPVRTQKRLGTKREAPVIPVQGGIPKGLAALARQRRKGENKGKYLRYIRALHERLNPSLLKRKPSSSFKDIQK